MANFIPRQGFKFAYNLYGKCEAQVIAYPADKARGTNAEIFVGDAVTLTGGFVLPFASSGTGTGGPALGVVVGVSKAIDPTVTPTATSAMNAAPPYDPTNLQQRSLATADAGWVYVLPAAGNVFSVLNIAATAIANVGAAGFSVVGTPGTAIAAGDAHGTITGAAGYTGTSNMAISSGLSTNQDVKILAVQNLYVGGLNSNAGENDPASVNNAVLVTFKNPIFG